MGPIEAEYRELVDMQDNELFVEGANIWHGTNKAIAFIKQVIKRDDLDEQLRELKSRYNTEDVYLVYYER
jgi:hypothetical protein